MNLFKALFSGIANFFKVLFGGVFAAVNSVFDSEGSVDVTAPVAWSQSDELSAPSPAPVESAAGDASAPVMAAAAAEPEVPETPATPDGPIEIKEMSVPEGPVSYASLNNLLDTPRPNRRPGQIDGA